MNLFDIFQEKTEFQKNQAQIKKSKEEIVKVLKAKGFQKNEIEQVTAIIDDAQAQIQRIKDSLIGSNIITDEEKDKNPKQILENAERQIDNIIKNMLTMI